MACVDLPPANADSEMEEGEIVDEVDYLSDISSEEEFLLRQRLKVLENYNNALERKEAKKSIKPGVIENKDPLYSDISGTDIEDSFLKTKFVVAKEKKHVKSHHKPRRSKQSEKDIKTKEFHKKKRNKIKMDSSESEDSDSSDDDITTKRRKLADAVALNVVKHDTTSTLKERLSKMLNINNSHCNKEFQRVIPNIIKKEHSQNQKNENTTSSANLKTSEILDSKIKEVKKEPSIISIDIVDSPSPCTIEENNNSQENSDEDLELLRQHALKTKSAKAKNDQQKKKQSNKTEIQSEDEDSDTEELRMICLKSTLLKKAIEMKQKQKLQKRLSNSNMADFDICSSDIHIDNNTDIESVDMEIGSDAEDKGKELIKEFKNNSKTTPREEIIKKKRNDDELEEDEDLLRAKLLTSLSKNLPNLVDINVLDTAFSKENNKKINKKLPDKPPPKQNTEIEQKKFIIQLGESDSEGENEATKNLTKMHLKLSESEFQVKLDQFLKTTRREVEMKKLPDVVQEPVVKPPQKFVAKTMNHLPKSEQIEYKNLVKRMAELEKLKQARQHAINVNNKNNNPKDTLKPRNFATDTYNAVFAKRLEERIALSRKNIAEESAKILKLKDEATKLSQRYKIVATELKNIATAITLNKKQQKTLQNGLNKIRHQHQMLLKSAPTIHSNQQLSLGRPLDVMLPVSRLQKENAPLKVPILEQDKVTNDQNKGDIQTNPILTIQVDISNNRKVVKLPKNPTKSIDNNRHSPDKDIKEIIKSPMENVPSDKNGVQEEIISNEVHEHIDDYNSPLDSLKCKNWEEDPNAVLCPFDFGGSCRDPDCKYLHPKISK